MAGYVPDRGDICWLDLEPSKGREVGKYRPVLVLSSAEYNRRTGMLICSPISTSIRGARTEVPLDNLEQPSVVAASIVQTLSWRERRAKWIAHAQPGTLEAVLQRLLPLMGADRLSPKAS